MQVTVDGARVYIQTGGQPLDPGRPTVVFLHGAGMDHSIWGQQTRYFAHHGYSVAAVDLPGHGRSAGPALPGVSEMAGWVASLLDALEVARAGLVGHSMGALIALEAAAQHAERVAAIALLGAALRMPVHPALLEAAQNDLAKAADLIAAWAHGARAHRGGNVASGIWLIRGAVQLLRRSAPGVLAADLEACNVYQGAPEAAERVACPTLLIVGSADRMTPMKAAMPLGEAITQANTVIIPDGGHMIMLEEPAQTLSALRLFLSEMKVDA